MSLNDIEKVDHAGDDRLQAIRENASGLEGLSTEEEYLKLEYDILNFDQRMKEIENNLLDLDRFKENDSHFFNQKIELLRIMFSSFYKKKEDLINSLNTYRSRIQLQKNLINGNIKEINQKLGSIKNLKNAFVFSFTESFNNAYNINYQNLVSGNINVDFYSKTATLPIADRSIAGISNIYIGRESNGRPGNFLSKRNSLPYYLIDGNELTYFEYHSAEEETSLRCDLVFELKKETIINRIELKRKSQDVASDINIKDIKFISAGGEVSIQRLVDTRMQDFRIPSIENEGRFCVNHLPVKTKKVVIELQQENNYVVNKRKIYSINIESVFFYSQKYLSFGEYNLNYQELGSGFFTGKGVLKCFPKENGHVSEIKLLENDKKSKAYPLVNGETSSILLDGTEKRISYTFSSRKNMNFNTTNESIPLLKTKSKEKQVNRSSNTDTILLNEPYEAGKLFVYEPTLRRSKSIKDSVFLGAQSGNGTASFEFPFLKYKFKEEDISIYVNKEKIPSSDYSFDPSDERIIIDLANSGDALLKRIRAKLNFKKPKCFLKQEGIYIYIDEEFDIDQDNIKLTNYVKQNPRTENLQSSILEHYLEGQNITDISITVDGTEFDSQGFNIDSARGYLRIPDGFPESEISIQYRSKIESKIEEYFVWIEDSPQGLFVPVENVKTSSHKQFLSTDSTQSKSFQLRNNSILLNTVKIDFDNFKEKTFINGKTEFENVLTMEREKVPSIETDSGYIDFNLSESYISTLPFSAYDERKDISFTVVKNAEVGTLPEVNELYIYGEGLCILNIGEGNISEEIYLSYSYSGREDQEKYFSVDGPRGIIYFSEPIENPNEKEISYSVFDLDIEYSVINRLEFEERPGEVLFSTNELFRNRSKVKATWAYTEDSLTFEDMEEYFSPIFYEMTLGFN